MKRALTLAALALVLAHAWKRRVDQWPETPESWRWG